MQQPANIRRQTSQSIWTPGSERACDHEASCRPNEPCAMMCRRGPWRPAMGQSLERRLPPEMLTIHRSREHFPGEPSRNARPGAFVRAFRSARPAKAHFRPRSGTCHFPLRATVFRRMLATLRPREHLPGKSARNARPRAFVRAFGSVRSLEIRFRSGSRTAHFPLRATVFRRMLAIPHPREHFPGESSRNARPGRSREHFPSRTSRNARCGTLPRAFRRASG